MPVCSLVCRQKCILFTYIWRLECIYAQRLVDMIHIRTNWLTQKRTKKNLTRQFFSGKLAKSNIWESKLEGYSSFVHYLGLSLCLLRERLAIPDENKK